MIEKLQQRREELQKMLQQTAIQLEQLRGAISLCDQLIAEATNDMEAVNNSERQLPT